MFKSFPVDQVIYINKHMIEQYGGLKGTVDLNKLKGALSRVDNFVTYEGANDAFDIAAKYAAAIVESHAFTDGNKRTALFVAIHFLWVNNYKIYMLDESWIDIALSIATSETTYKKFGDFLYDQYIQQNKKD